MTRSLTLTQTLDYSLIRNWANLGLTKRITPLPQPNNFDKSAHLERWFRSCILRESRFEMSGQQIEAQVIIQVYNPAKMVLA